MNDEFRKKVIVDTFSNPLLQELSKNMSAKDKKVAEDLVAEFVDMFCMNVYGAISKSIELENKKKIPDNLDESLITKENA